MRIEINFNPLEFFKYDGSIIYMLDNFSEGLVIQPLEYDIPLIKISALTLGKGGILVGYIIKVPKKYKLLKNSLQVGSDFTNTELHSGILGLQIFESSNGVTLISTKITPFFERIDKPL